MPLAKERVAEIVKEYGKNEQDTGNSDVQVALLTARINHITTHLRTNKKDHHGRYGLLKLVGQRKALIDYIKTNDIAHYRELIVKLGIRK